MAVKVGDIWAEAFDLNPEPWAVGAISVGRSKNGGTYIPKVAPDHTMQTYQEAIRAEIIARAIEPVAMLPDPYSVRFHFSRRRTKYKVKRGDTDTENTRNQADVTNMQKATEDALQHLIISNDREVIRTASAMLGPQTADSDTLVIVEIRFGCRGYDPEQTTFGTEHLTEQAQRALTELKIRQQSDLIIDNDWEY